MITTIFLDLDDTLFSFQQAEQVALEETMRHYALPYAYKRQCRPCGRITTVSR